MALIAAHAELENVRVERDLARFKRHGRPALDRAGLRRTVVLAAADARSTAFMTEASKHVTGDVRRAAADRPAVVTGRREPGWRCTTTGWRPTTPATRSTRPLAKGFVELWGLPSKIAAERDRKAARA